MCKKTLWIIAVAFSFVLGQSAFAHSLCGQSMDKMVESLKLDDAQKAKVKPVLDQLKSNMQSNWTQMKDLETQINQQVQSANMDQSTVDGLVDKKTALIGNMMKAKIAAKNQIFNVLNAQQKETLQAKMKAKEDKIAAEFKSCHDQD